MGDDISSENLKARLEEDFDDSDFKNNNSSFNKYSEVTSEANRSVGSVGSQSQIPTLSSQDLLLISLQKKKVRQDYDRRIVFWTLFREEGVQDKYRGGLWINLLGAAELRAGHHSTFFAKLAEMPNKELETRIDNDTIAERSDLLVSKDVYLKPDPVKMKKIILTYANIDMELGYN